jgi:isopenicillin N synthase-like dioxygenase
MERVPELSLRAYTNGTGEERRRFIDDLFVGLKQYGFIVLKDHPVDVKLLNKAYEYSRKFFELPENVKRSYADVNGTAGMRGYTPFGKEHAKDAKVPDLKEFWHVGRELHESHRLKKFFPNNVWPNELPEFKPIFQTLFQALDDTGRIMLEALTGPLEVEKDFFTRMTENGSSILRMLHYPPIPATADPRSIRAAAHEDINLITLLVSASASGLQLLDRKGQWLNIDSDPENIIVDSGDMLARITNDVITALRNIRGENRIKPGQMINAKLNPADDTAQKVLGKNRTAIMTLARVENLEIGPVTSFSKCAVQPVHLQNFKVDVVVPLAGLVDIDEEVKRIQKNIEKLEKDQSGLARRLEDANFVKNAPEEILAQSKEQLEGNRNQLATMRLQLSRLQE